MATPLPGKGAIAGACSNSIAARAWGFTAPVKSAVLALVPLKSKMMKLFIPINH